MQYRREIDGLRAVAVVPVILFHAGFTIFSGGYVGVDIFFVISGYLITTIIIKELDQGNFSILRFYERRARRILPALFLIMFLCIPFAWMWMLPSQSKVFLQSLIAVSSFVSNMFFWLESGYFAVNAAEYPLLHTWSLAVEEQYYLIFPVFLILFWRFGRKPVFYCIIVVSIFSLALSEWAWRYTPTANFYLVPTRAWELLAGSICAFLKYEHAQKSNNPLSILGLLLILFAIFFYDESTPIPSIYAIAPVGGTALIIMYATQGSWVARLLSLKPFVGIGLISYSAYLWHQPLFAFARIRSLNKPDQLLMLFLAAASLGLAYLSWRFIERPFRAKPVPALSTRRAVFGASAVVSVIFISIGLSGHFGNGFEDRFDPGVLKLSKYKDDINPYRKKCHFNLRKTLPVHPVPDCKDFMIGDEIDVAFVGDSHSDAISYAAQSFLLENDISSYAVSFSECIGLEGFSRRDEYPKLACNEYNKKFVEYIRNNGIPTIVLTSRFTMYWSSKRFDNTEGGVEEGKPVFMDLIKFQSKNSGQDSEAHRQRMLKSYTEKLLSLAQEFNVILVYPIPEAGWNVPQQLSKLAILQGVNANQSLSTSYSVFLDRNSAIIEAFDAMDHPNLYRVKPHEILCNTFTIGRCINAIKENVIYVDDDHLSNAGAKLLAPTILEQIRKIKKKISLAK